jgi:hypothetical protein
MATALPPMNRDRFPSRTPGRDGVLDNQPQLRQPSRMAKTKGNRDIRMDRIERALELLIAGHEQFRHNHKQLLTTQVLQKDEIDQLLKVA